MTDTVINGWPDAEKCIGTLLRPLVEHDAHIGNHVILDYDEQVGDQDTPFIELHRRGGPTDLATFTDWPVVEVLCWGKSRAVAQETMDGVIRLLLLDNLDGHFMAGDGFFDTVEDVTGSEEVESSNPDDRCVSRTFQLSCRPMYD
jgi:hypothetical protein